MSLLNNVDVDEVNKFEQISGDWWDSEGKFRPLHDINPLRMRYIDERVSLAEKKVLDVGCGGGILSESMAFRGASVTGIDVAENALRTARSHAEFMKVSVDYCCCTVEMLSEEKSGAYDVITCLEMLEHVPNPASIVKACNQLLKPGGHIFFSTINRNPKAWLFAIAGAEYILKLLPKGTHQYKKFIQPHELCCWMRENSLQYNDIMGLTYNPLTQLYKLDNRDVSVNYLLYGRKPD